jgi:hypothetical protein
MLLCISYHFRRGFQSTAPHGPIMLAEYHAGNCPTVHCTPSKYNRTWLQCARVYQPRYRYATHHKKHSSLTREVRLKISHDSFVASACSNSLTERPCSRLRPTPKCKINLRISIRAEVIELNLLLSHHWHSRETTLRRTILTACSRAILDKLIVTQLLKNSTAFYGTRSSITVFTRARHWSLS